MEKKLLNHSSVKKSSVHGFGVFAERDFLKNDVIEETHVLLTEGKDSTLKNYYFDCKDKSAIPLGHGCIYNHSDHPNAIYYFDAKREIFIFVADRFIKKGQEIFISYGEDWFSSRDTACKELSFLRKTWRFFSGLPLRALVACSGVYFIIFLLKILGPAT